MLYYTRNMWLYVCWKQDSIIGPVVSCVISVCTSNTIFGSLCSFLKSAKDSKFFLHSAGMEAQYSKILTYIVLQFFKVPSKTFWNQYIFFKKKLKKPFWFKLSSYILQGRLLLEPDLKNFLITPSLFRKIFIRFRWLYILHSVIHSMYFCVQIKSTVQLWWTTKI